VEVLRVERASAASRAGLRPGDVITIAGDLQAPTAGQLARLFAAEPATSPVLIVIARGDAHQVAVLEKKP
jgi:S1-C subfamily serine protease